MSRRIVMKDTTPLDYTCADGAGDIPALPEPINAWQIVGVLVDEDETR